MRYFRVYSPEGSQVDCMRLIDMHCDTLGKLLDYEKKKRKRKATKGAEDIQENFSEMDLMQNDFCIHIPGMRKLSFLPVLPACLRQKAAMRNVIATCFP